MFNSKASVSLPEIFRYPSYSLIMRMSVDSKWCDISLVDHLKLPMVTSLRPIFPSYTRKFSCVAAQFYPVLLLEARHLIRSLADMALVASRVTCSDFSAR